MCTRSTSKKKYQRWAKRARKSTQVCKTRTSLRTCEGWPNGLASWKCLRMPKLTPIANPYASSGFANLPVRLARALKRQKQWLAFETDLTENRLFRDSSDEREAHEQTTKTERKGEISTKKTRGGENQRGALYDGWGHGTDNRQV